jgi:hypothetical protein
MKKIKVFCSNCLSLWTQKICYVTPINWLLKLNHQKFSNSKDQYEWTEPYFLVSSESLDLEAAYKIIEEEQIDVIAFSVYIWNRDEFFSMAKFFKEKNPNLTIIVGGPDIDAHRDTTFFAKNPFFDYVVYGEGEIALTRLLDHLQGHDVELVNVVSKDGTVFKHEPVNKKDEVLKTSPYIEFKEEIARFLEQFKKKQIMYAIVWETTKGCPYLCSFCDWSSGLHHKVRIWGKDELIPSWKKELDMFSELKIPLLYWTNPNVGLTPQDTEIVDYACQLKSSNKHVPLFIGTQFSKTKKQHSYMLMDKLLTHSVTAGFKFDLQDLDRTVLDAIDRPEMPWEEHKVLIKEILTKHGSKRGIFQPVWCNFIWGLPEQTLRNMRTNMIELGSLGVFPNHHIFECLPNSPAAEPAYQEKFGMRIQRAYINIVEGIYLQPGPISNHYANAVVETASLPEKDWFTGVFVFLLYGCVTNFALSDKDIGPDKEANFFDNTIQLMETVIDNSYQHFKDTHRVEVMFNGKAQGFQNFVVPRKAKLKALFDKHEIAAVNIQQLLNTEHSLTTAL